MSFNRLDATKVISGAAKEHGLILAEDDLARLAIALVDGSRTRGRCNDGLAEWLIGLGTTLNPADSRGRALDMFEHLKSEFIGEAQSSAYEQLRVDLEAELRDELKPIVIGWIRKEAEDKWTPIVREELRKELEPIIRAELEAELGAQKEAAQ